MAERKTFKNDLRHDSESIETKVCQMVAIEKGFLKAMQRAILTVRFFELSAFEDSHLKCY